MIDFKLFEVRDNATCIIVAAFTGEPADQSPQEQWMLGHCGWNENPFCYMTWLEMGQTHYAWRNWNSRTLSTAHKHIEEHWDELASGDVVDVRYILGETEAPAKSDRFWMPEAVTAQTDAA